MITYRHMSTCGTPRTPHRVFSFAAFPLYPRPGPHRCPPRPRRPRAKMVKAWRLRLWRAVCPRPPLISHAVRRACEFVCARERSRVFGCMGNGVFCTSVLARARGHGRTSTADSVDGPCMVGVGSAAWRTPCISRASGALRLAPCPTRCECFRGKCTEQLERTHTPARSQHACGPACSPPVGRGASSATSISARGTRSGPLCPPPRHAMPRRRGMARSWDARTRGS